jgi:hypothetical protein
MSDPDHARYLALLESLYLGSKLSPREHEELTRLHAQNAKRVGMITTGTNEAKT